MITALRLALSAAWLFVAAPAVAQAPPFRPDPAALRFLQAMVAEDAETRYRGGVSLFDWDYADPEVRANPTQIYLAYQQNQIAADRLYRRRRIELDAAILAVRQDPSGLAYVEFAASGYAFENVKGALVRGMEGAAATWRTGTRVSLICTGAGMSLLGPLLENCHDLEWRVRWARQRASSQMEDWVAGHGSDTTNNSPPDKLLSLFIVYWAGMLLPQDAPCRIRPSQEACESILLRLAREAEERSPRFVQAYTAAQARLRLPATNGR